jgi:hypothetical protein
MKVWAVRNMGLFLFFIYYNIYYKFCPSLYGMGGMQKLITFLGSWSVIRGEYWRGLVRTVTRGEYWRLK